MDMKQLVFETGIVKIVGIEFPEGTTNIRKGSLDEYFYDDADGETHLLDLPYDVSGDDWKYVGTKQQIIQREWHYIVDRHCPESHYTKVSDYRYKDYVNSGIWNMFIFTDPVESIENLLESVGIFKNPHGDHDPRWAYYNSTGSALTHAEQKREQWNTAQQRVQDPERTHFFIIPNRK